MSNDGVDFEKFDALLTRVRPIGYTLCAVHESILRDSNTYELAFRKTGRFQNVPVRGKVRTGTAEVSLLPARLCALRRSTFRTNTAVVPASPQWLIRSTTAPKACVRAESRSHIRPFTGPHRIARPRSFPIEWSGFWARAYVVDGQLRYTTRNRGASNPVRRDFFAVSPPERKTDRLSPITGPIGKGDTWIDNGRPHFQKRVLEVQNFGGR